MRIDPMLASAAGLALLAACSTAEPAAPPPEAFTPMPAPTAPAPPAQPVQIPYNAFIFHVQQRLQQLGYYKGTVDGANGPMTKAAVRAFQRDNGLTPTGVVNQHTDTMFWPNQGK